MSRSPYQSDLIDITVTIIHQTDLAVKVDHGGKEPTWLPRSAIEIEKNDDGKTWTVTLPERLAEEKGMI